MTRDDKRLRWFALAGIGFLATIIAPAFLTPDSWQIRYPDTPDDPLWGVLMGITCYALINAVVLRGDAARENAMMQTPRIGLWAILTFGLGGAAVVMLAGQHGVIPNWPDILKINAAQLATMLILALVAPTEAQGLLVPLGDERFRANQHRAQSFGLRIAFVSCLGLGAVASYTALPFPWPVVFAALATVTATGYLTALWWLERQDET